MFEHDFPFDPTYGYTLNDLLAIQPPIGPDDFARFWQDTYQQAMAVPLRLERLPTDLGDANVRVDQVAFDSFAGVRIGGWLVTPRDGKITRGLVVGHGYGSNVQPAVGLMQPGTALLCPCIRGLGCSQAPGLPNTPAMHVIHHINDREKYILRGSTADLWASATALLELVPQVAGELYYYGGSFCGGLGALALPWDRRFKKAHLRVPTFGHHPIRVQCPCNGSGRAVTAYHRRHPEVLDVLQYFDAATAAGHIRIPTLVSPALFDPSVPPPGQFAVYNAIPEQWRSLMVRQAGHFAYPNQAEDDQKALDCMWQFFGFA